MPTARTVQESLHGSPAPRGGRWRAAAFFAAFVAVLGTAIVWLSDPSRVVPVSAVLGAIAAVVAVVAIARSDRDHRRYPVIWLVVGAAPVVIAGLVTAL